MTAALSTRGLDKSFGSLVVAKDIAIDLPQGARYALIGALILIIGVPLYQLLILAPSGYGNALTTVAQSLGWIHTHVPLFLGYRALLIVGFALMLGLPFTLFRIIIAQEILGREEDEDEQADTAEEDGQEQAGIAQGGQDGQAVVARDAGDAGGAGHAGCLRPGRSGRPRSGRPGPARRQQRRAAR